MVSSGKQTIVMILGAKVLPRSSGLVSGNRTQSIGSPRHRSADSLDELESAIGHLFDFVDNLQC